MNTRTCETVQDSLNIESLRTFARDLARSAGTIAKSYAGRMIVERKHDDSPVTDADHAVQAAIFDAIARTYPDHAVIGEETIRRPERHAKACDARYCWVVDPIDGTRNFARGAPLYATSIAVMDCGETIAGAIHEAVSGCVYSAGRKMGAFRDNDAIRVADRPFDTDTTVLVSSFRKRTMPNFVRAWMDAYNFRNVGSICLHLAWTAAGIAEGSYASECRLWDIAAGALLIREAGGVVTRGDGGPLWPIDVGAYDGGDVPILCGTPAMHARLLESLCATENDN